MILNLKDVTLGLFDHPFIGWETGGREPVLLLACTSYHFSFVIE